ncbi:S-adenosylmethionine-dependent methyltransferase [Aspergillus novofumigatus IBT 16806]|uniref:Putative SET and MYND domain protein n=1 Tax=Aspergillus novofumigatus (strain IBT 16806) TaxID=1392255 RepID=A0A2I1CMH6_ASPN1|nr:putative SET and MYND domain protein [Aspergillus novofumigatus IBT 16806]PKX98819.1 putative SET and MYND domain protein [Aspergillus novofumigatus IBT 16806]
MASITDLQRSSGKVPEDILNEDILARLLDQTITSTDPNQDNENITDGGFQNPIPPVYTRGYPAPSPGAGTGIFSGTDIPVGGTVMLIQRPFVAVLDTERLQDTCSGCLGQHHYNRDANVELKACTGCRVVKYCNKTCQAKDWKFAHSFECRIFKELMPRVLPSNARAILRMVLRSERGKYPKEELELFRKLESHMDEIQAQNWEQWQRISLTAKAVKKYSGCAMDEEMICHYGAKLELNSYNFHSPLADRLGFYLHPYAALINHSCDYNSVVGSDGDALYVKALRPIQKGEEILVSYIDATNPYKTRQNELSERYYFKCRCPKCGKGTSTREDRFLGQPHDVSVPEDAESAAMNVLNRVGSSRLSPSEAADEIKRAMKALHRTAAWPITRQPMVALRDELITCLLSEDEPYEAFVHAAVRFRLVDPVVYPEPGHPTRQMHAWVFAMLANELMMQGVPALRGKKDSSAVCAAIWQSVLFYLMNELEMSSAVPTLKKIIRRAFAEGPVQMYNHGLRRSPGELIHSMRRAWSELDEIINEALEKEKA